MSREEFLKQLKESLSMSLEKAAINEQLDYYDKYISDEINKGRSEKEIIEELGDPRLIAKTIKTVSGSDIIADNSSNDTSEDRNNDYGSYGGYGSYGSSNRGSYTGSSQNNQKSVNYRGYVSQNGTIGCIIAGLVMFIIIYAIFSFVGNIAYGVGELAFSGPIGFLLVAGIFYLLFGRGRR